MEGIAELSFFRIEKQQSTFTNCYSLIAYTNPHLVTEGIDARCEVMIEEFQQRRRRHSHACESNKQLAHQLLAHSPNPFQRTESRPFHCEDTTMKRPEKVPAAPQPTCRACNRGRASGSTCQEDALYTDDIHKIHGGNAVFGGTLCRKSLYERNDERRREDRWR